MSLYLADPDLYRKARRIIAGLAKTCKVASLVPEYTEQWLGNTTSDFPAYVKLDLRTTGNPLRAEIRFGSIDYTAKRMPLKTKRTNGYPTTITIVSRRDRTSFVFEWEEEIGWLSRTTGPARIKAWENDEPGTVVSGVDVQYALSGSDFIPRDEFVQWYEMTHLEEYKGL